MAPPRVAACVVTGFLGSGKTTLLAGLLERDPRRDRIAVIVNEIGEIGIDGRVLTGFEYVESVVELASGCVCCSIDEYRFDLAVDELVRRLDPLLVVLETSGVADPAPTIERLRRCGLGVDAVVTVVDALAWRRAWTLSRAARRQVDAADFLVLSKTDLVPRAALERLRRRLARRNPRARILEGAGSRPFDGSDLLLATSAAGRSAAAPAERRSGVPARRQRTLDLPDAAAAQDAATGRQEPGTPATEQKQRGAPAHLAEDRIESFSWRTERPVDRAALERALAQLPPEVWRAKGLVRGEGERHAWLFQVVCGRVDVSVLESATAIEPGVQAVFIGRDLGAWRTRIEAMLEACAIAT